MVNMVGVVFGLAFSRFPSRSNGVTHQRLSSAFQIFGIHGQEIRFVFGEMAGNRIDGAEIDDGGVDRASDGHDRDPSHEIGFSSFDVIIHDGTAAVVLGMVPCDGHGRLVAIQNADGTTWRTRFGEWASGQVRSVHFQRCTQSKSISGSDVDVIALAGRKSRDCVREDVHGQVSHMNPITTRSITDFHTVSSDGFAAIEQRLAPLNHHEGLVIVLDS